MVYAALYVLLLVYGPKRLNLLLLLPLIALDCTGSVVIGESFGSTISAKAHDAALDKQPYWSWAESCIDWLFSFQPQHCRRAWDRELQHGSVWKAWRADWRAL